MSKKIIVVGAGFAGLAAAASLAQKGHQVTILEKNEGPGGRARQYQAQGFTFDMGPSWYWMPEVFEDFFQRFGKSTADYYELLRLDPSYIVYFGKDDEMEVPAKMEALYAMFESYEPGSSTKLKQFLDEAAYKYKVGMKEFVFKPSHSIMEFADLRILKSMFGLQMFSSVSSAIRKLFKNEKLIQLLEFPVLFLGATPQKTPALYSLMNYADLALGTWYPKGGMHEIVKAMVSLAEEQGVEIRYNQEVKQIKVVNGKAKQVVTIDQSYEVDAVVGGADYHHLEQQVLEPHLRNYSASYWDKRTMAPSSLLFYVGVDKKLPGLHHHNLFFDEDFALHAEEIYENPKWPTKPLFYVCAPSVTDETVAPAGQENLFFLIPLAPDLEDTDELREKYFEVVLQRFENITGHDIRDHIVYRRSYAHRDFEKDYHAFKGNAYGLANTLLQTAFLKPKMRNRKVSNLFFTGQLTTPGPGVPPSLISGQVVAEEVDKVL
ncbi:phytoene desaturase family protein [Lewinella cohaerens]|uniref:phytoene desaturase family protein n=1 Tax=Lewinella cohaerens TaxID=70995 RepID=UPI0003600017|nr:phytoene desaturase family protein [Lewinella cohaerens]